MTIEKIADRAATSAKISSESAPSGAVLTADGSGNSTFSSLTGYATLAADQTFTGENSFPKVNIGNEAGSSATAPLGQLNLDNVPIAWGRVTASGTLDENYNVSSITKVGTGHYKVHLATSATSGFTLIPVVTLEVDEAVGNVPPTGAANVRLAVSNQFFLGSNFDVYVYNGSFNSVENDFQFVVLER